MGILQMSKRLIGCRLTAANNPTAELIDHGQVWVLVAPVKV